MDIYAQRLNGNGDTLWEASGVPVCLADSIQGINDCISDSADGGIATWLDYRNGRKDIYAQRINGNAEAQWDTGGVYIATTITASGGIYTAFTTVSDGRGGGIVTWIDGRSGNWDIYSQRVDSKGQVKWDSGGVGVCTDPTRIDNIVMATDGYSGAIIAWWDDRRPPDCPYGSIYAQRVDSTGTLKWRGIEEEPWFTVLPREVRLEQNYPNPFNSNTAISYQVSGIRPHRTTLKIYNILGEEVRTLLQKRQRPGFYRVIWDGKDKEGGNVCSGIYFCQLKVGRFSQARKMLLIR